VYLFFEFCMASTTGFHSLTDFSHAMEENTLHLFFTPFLLTWDENRRKSNLFQIPYLNGKYLRSRACPNIITAFRLLWLVVYKFTVTTNFTHCLCLYYIIEYIPIYMRLRNRYRLFTFPKKINAIFQIGFYMKIPSENLDSKLTYPLIYLSIAFIYT
jgi:hypothetical protein